MFMKTARKKLCIVSAIPMSLNVFMRPHIEMLAQDYDLTLIANGVANEFVVSNASGVKIMPVAIARDINLIHDLKALLSLAGIFRREKFDAVHSITPKAGLLSMLAATLTRTGS